MAKPYISREELGRRQSRTCKATRHPPQDQYNLRFGESFGIRNRPLKTVFTDFVQLSFQKCLKATSLKRHSGFARGGIPETNGWDSGETEDPSTLHCICCQHFPDGEFPMAFSASTVMLLLRLELVCRL